MKNNFSINLSPSRELQFMLICDVQRHNIATRYYYIRSATTAIDLSITGRRYLFNFYLNLNSIYCSLIIRMQYLYRCSNAFIGHTPCNILIDVAIHLFLYPFPFYHTQMYYFITCCTHFETKTYFLSLISLCSSCCQLMLMRSSAVQ